jgi:hypothetical protein
MNKAKYFFVFLSCLILCSCSWNTTMTTNKYIKRRYDLYNDRISNDLQAFWDKNDLENSKINNLEDYVNLDHNQTYYNFYWDGLMSYRLTNSHNETESGTGEYSLIGNTFYIKIIQSTNYAIDTNIEANYLNHWMYLLVPVRIKIYENNDTASDYQTIFIRFRWNGEPR